MSTILSVIEIEKDAYGIVLCDSTTSLALKCYGTSIKWFKPSPAPLKRDLNTVSVSIQHPLVVANNIISSKSPRLVVRKATGSSLLQQENWATFRCDVGLQALTSFPRPSSLSFHIDQRRYRCKPYLFQTPVCAPFSSTEFIKLGGRVIDATSCHTQLRVLLAWPK